MITVIGAGSWGSALAGVLNANDQSLCLVSRNQSLLQEITSHNTNSKYLGKLKLFKNLNLVSTTTVLDQAITQQTKYIVIALPCEYFLSTINQIKKILTTKKLPNIIIINSTKGLAGNEHDAAEHSNSAAFQWLHEVIEKKLGKDYPYCMLSGPSFAQEVAQYKPTSIVMAAKNLELAQETSKLFHNEWFRVYTNNDVLGVELGGALKNILAFAVGCAEGYGFGSNACAAIITRGLHEMMSLGKALNVKQETITGLSGLGDLVLTATDNQSRNKRFGNYIGQGLDIDSALAKVGQHVASFTTTKLIHQLVKEYQLDLPITEQAYNLLYENVGLEQVINNLMSRPQKAE